MTVATIAVLAAISFSAGALHPLAADSKPRAIRIGMLLPADPAQADAMRAGATQGVALARASGLNVELVARSRQGQWGVEGEEAAQLALADEAQGLVSPPSGASTHLVLQVAGRTALPTVSLCPDSSISGSGIPWMRQVVPETRLEAETLFKHFSAAGMAPAKTWLAIVPAGRQGREFLHDLREAAAKSGVSIQQAFELRDSGLMGEFQEPPPPPAADSAKARPGPTPATSSPSIQAEPLLSVLRTTRPDGILVWIPDQRASSLLEAIGGSGYKGVLGGPGCLLTPGFRTRPGGTRSRLMLAVPEPLAKPIVPVPPPEGPRRADWLRMMACDAVVVLADLCEQAEASGMRSPAREGLRMGTTGPLKFSQDGRREVPMTVLPAE